MKRDIAVTIAVLAAGRSSRMGGANKLLAIFDGKPLVRRSVEVAMQADSGRVCPSSNDLRLFGLWKNGVSGSVIGLI